MAKTIRHNTRTVNLNGENTDRQAKRIAIIKNRKIESNRRNRDHHEAIHDTYY